MEILLLIFHAIISLILAFFFKDGQMWKWSNWKNPVYESSAYWFLRFLPIEAFIIGTLIARYVR